MLGKQLIQAAAGAAGAGGGALYADDVFSTYLYYGTGAEVSYNNGIDLSGEGGLVWIKARDGTGTFHHALTDSARGVDSLLSSNQSVAAFSGGIKTFNSDGFTLQAQGDDANNTNTNKGGRIYVSWSFRKAPGFFDVVTFTSSGASSQQIAHNLGSVPGCIIVKNLGSGGWYIYHRGVDSSSPENYGMQFTTAARNDNAGFWNNTAPTSTHFTLGNIYESNTDTYVAYVFAHDEPVFGADEDESIIKCGTFNTYSSQPLQVNLGFEPQWVMLKGSSGSNPTGWEIYNSMTGLAHGQYTRLAANNSGAEVSGAVPVCTANATGFEIENCNSSTTFIYMAIRRPHKPPTAATEVFAVDTGNSSSTIPAFDSGFPVDFALLKEYNTGPNDNFTFSRLTGQRVMRTNTDVAEVNGGGLWIGDSNVGWSKQYNNTNISYMFKRAPGFMDVVAYTGNNSGGANQIINHNLGVTPELVIVKSRTLARNWFVWSSLITEQYFLELNENNPISAGGNDKWQPNSTFTSTQFGVGTQANVNSNGDTFIALLFATLSGISKVGSYTGTGNAINVDCGFSSGARFILIKRTDSTGDWFVYDTTRGIVSGNDPYLLLNTNAAEVTNTDYIDPLSSGFTVTSSAPTGLNASGGAYIFLAIA